MTTTFGDLGRGIRQKELADTVARLGRKYLIFSGKGGVGKTTLAVNLAWVLAKSGRRVGILDIDLHGPDLAAALYLDANLTADDKGRLIPVEVIPGLWAMTVQYLLSDANQAVMWRGPRKIRAIAQFLGDTAWPELDYFFIDSPPGTGDETLGVVNMIKDLTALVVVTGHRLAIVDAHKAIGCLRQSNSKVLGLVENQASLVCPACGQAIPLNDPTKVESLASQTNLKILARLPYDPLAVAQAERAQMPLAEASPESPLTALLKELAQSL
ncbi:MAG: Mrp/NBP35 family ATP-binding protein [Deltaproteobacteria bacterium]|jgi:Mrp family chromosome partitioning ATPase|nr:Mrp/NBP35 family ATP-binding protein [Deltaproteobacteria bacterium]